MPPPKRRRATEPGDAPEAKKRVTRSSSSSSSKRSAKVDMEASPKAAKEGRSRTNSSRPLTLRKEALESKKAASKHGVLSTSVSTSTSPKTKTSKTESSKPWPSPKTNNNKSSASKMPKGLDSKTSSDYTTLTITHDSVKSPIQCHSYASPSTIAPPTLVFTHGAGGTLSAPAVTDFCKGYSNSNSSSSPVLAFQGSMNLGARTKGFHACLEHLRRASSVSNNKHGNRGTTGDFVLLGGRSMGARAAVIALTEHLSFTASSTSSSASSASPPLLILASYPLQGPKDVRDQILVDLPACVSVLFVVGDRDSMCPLDMLDHVRKKMKAQSWLIVVEGADHGMHVGGGGGGGKEKEMLLGAMVGSMASEWVGGSREKREEKIWWDEDERRIGRGLV